MDRIAEVVDDAQNLARIKLRRVCRQDEAKAESLEFFQQFFAGNARIGPFEQVFHRAFPVDLVRLAERRILDRIEQDHLPLDILDEMKKQADTLPGGHFLAIFFPKPLDDGLRRPLFL